jgi:hypothetical protein
MNRQQRRRGGAANRESNPVAPDLVAASTALHTKLTALQNEIAALNDQAGRDHDQVAGLQKLANIYRKIGAAFDVEADRIARAKARA